MRPINLPSQIIKFISDQKRPSNATAAAIITSALITITSIGYLIYQSRKNQLAIPDPTNLPSLGAPSISSRPGPLTDIESLQKTIDVVITFHLNQPHAEITEDPTKICFRNGFCKESCEKTFLYLEESGLIIDNKILLNGKSYYVMYATSEENRHAWLQLTEDNIERDGIFEDPQASMIIIEPSYLQFMGELSTDGSDLRYKDNPRNRKILKDNPGVFIGEKSTLIQKVALGLPSTQRSADDQGAIANQWNFGYKLTPADQAFHKKKL